MALVTLDTKDARVLATGYLEAQDLLDDVREFLDGYIDVTDGDYGEPRPNAAMQLASRIDDFLAKAKAVRS